MKLVTAAIIRKDDQVLLFRRGPGEKLEGMWEFPGGKLEDGESLEQCLIRELREELNIHATIGEEIGRSQYQYSHGEIELVALDVVDYSGEITLTVHDQTLWVHINELTDVDLAPADIALIEFL